MKRRCQGISWLLIVLLAAGCTPPPAEPRLEVRILGCTSPLDILRGGSDSTDLYVTVQNTGAAPAEHVVVSASAADEPQPVEQRVIPSLPAGYEWSARLRIPARLGIPGDVLVTAALSSGQGAVAELYPCPPVDADWLRAIWGCLEAVTPIGALCRGAASPPPAPTLAPTQ